MLNKFRSQTIASIESLRFQTALYWAEKAVTASAGLVEDVYMLGKTMYMCKQYHRAAQLMSRLHLDEKYLACKHLAAQCLYDAQLYSDALHLLRNDHMWNDTAQLPPNFHQDGPLLAAQQLSANQVHSSMYLLRGKIHEAMDNRLPAIEDYKTALKLDVYCNEAFELLIKHEMLTPEEENDLLDHLPFDEQCINFEGESTLVKALYADQVKKYCKPEERAPSSELSSLRDNLSIRVNHAQRLLNGCDYRGCFNMLQEIMKQDPNHQSCLPIYISCLVALNKSQLLFTLAHRLVDSEPDNATAWYSVGCYYYVIKRYEESRKYLHKTTTLDRNYGAAWLMRGHAFAAENEHDQAMAAYFKASQLMRGSHLPMLYVGLEHGLMNNVRLANSFFNQAHSLAPDDPFVLHELGSVAYQNGDYPLSEKCFLQAVDMVARLRQISGFNNASNDFPLDDTWEPLLNNLGHVCRKLRKYDQAIEFHQKALLVSPMRSSTYSALGYVHSLTGDAEKAVEYFQKALALKRDDTFSTHMLNAMLEACLNDAPPFLGAPKEIPPPEKIVPGIPSASLMTTPTASDQQVASTSNMEMSNMSMPDISEEDVLQMDTPGFYLDSRQDDSVLSGIGPLRTPSESLVTPVASGSTTTEYPGLRGEQQRGVRRPATNEEEITDEDTPISMFINRR